MSINHRIAEIKAALKLNNNQFAERIGVDPTVVYNIVDEKGRGNKPSFGFISKLVLSFDSINVDWLITGRGDKMFIEMDENKEPVSSTDELCVMLKKEIEELKKDKTVLAEQITLKDQQIQRLWKEIDELKTTAKK